MILTVSNKENQWFPAFGPNSVNLLVENLGQERTITPQGILLPGGNLLLSQRQEVLDKHLALIQITQNQQGTFEKKDEVFASAGSRIWIPVAVSYQSWRTLNSPEKTIKWRYTLPLAQS